MKKFLISIILYITAISACFGQLDHRISMGIGIFSHEYIDEIRREASEVDYYYPGPNDQPKTYEYTKEFLNSLPLTLNLHYELTLGKHFGVGLCLGYDYIKMGQNTKTIFVTEIQQTPSGANYTIWDHTSEYGKLYRNILFLMPEATIYWFKKRHVAMYSKLSAGMRFNIEKRVYENMRLNRTKLAEKNFYCHISPICVEFGGQKWRGFAEFGYGAQGIAQYGARYTIKGKEKNEVE